MLSLWITAIILLVNCDAFKLPYSESDLSVASHNMCTSKDRGPFCDLPDGCCCKQSHNNIQENFNDMEFISKRVLCVNLTRFPTSYPQQTSSLEILYSSEIEVFPEGSLAVPTLVNTSYIYINKLPNLWIIRRNTFSDLLNVKTILIENAPKLKEIEDNAFTNLPLLRSIKLEHVGIESIPTLRTLGESHEHLTLTLLATSIRVIKSNCINPFPNRIRMLYINHNQELRRVEPFAFNGTSLFHLSLAHNPNLETLEPDAFASLHSLIQLDLSNTNIKTLPSRGLHHLGTINAHNTPYLIDFPTSYELPALREANLTYPYHCCALGDYGFGVLFKNKNNNKEHLKRVPCMETEEGHLFQVEMSAMFLPVSKRRRKRSEYFYYGSGDPYYYNSLPSNYSDLNYGSFYDGDYPTSIDLGEDYNPYPEEDNGFGGFVGDGDGMQAQLTNGSTSQITTRSLCLIDENGKLHRDVFVTNVQCSPIPNAFNPCENVLGTTALPVVSWTVSCLAIVGNMFVIIVLSMVSCDQSFAHHHHHLSVSKFLVLNLAIADLCMGIYLLILSVMDATTNGEYFKFGVRWQTGPGCSIAGFLAVLSSQLSIYILSIISIERWYAIHFAIHLDKRMTMRCARLLVLVGWVCSITLALLPAFGINNYGNTSICLPMDVSKNSGLIYVAFLLLTSIAAFLVVVTCYLWMYRTVRTVNDSGRDGMFRRKRRSSTSSSKTNGSPLSSTVDATIAKRMAILVFTNFACFFPISFFVLTAAAGKPLISVSESKILLVIFFPLNSCCNPFLYAILTKSFRRDLLTWLTARGYCVRFASKRYGAQWHRKSSTTKKETFMRKKLQQCVKYVVQYKAVNIEFESKENNPVKQINNNDIEFKKAKCTQSQLPPNQQSLVEGGNQCDAICMMSKDPKNSCDESLEDNLYTSEQNKQCFIYKLPLLSSKMQRSKTYTPAQSTHKNSSCTKSFLRKTRCWKTADENGPTSKKVLEETRAGARKLLKDDLHDKDNDFSENDHNMKNDSSGHYTNCFSKPRHSTTTIETRITSSQKPPSDHELSNY